jgi:hypothetical protein
MQQLLPAKSTSRKFYNKWLYKITLQIGGANVLRYDLDRVGDMLAEDKRDNGYWGWQSKAYSDKEFIMNLVNFLQGKNKDSWSKRVERNYADFYTNDLDFFNELSDLAVERIRHRFAPEEGSIDILSDSSTSVAVKKLPHDRYQYKVYLLPHKMKYEKEEKQKYVDWLKRQVPKLTCTEAVEKWFVTTDWNWDRRYILVEDESMLLMLKLRNSEVVGRVYKYILCDK